MDIPLDAEVQCADGRCGQTSQVIINPVDNTITHVVVEDNSFEDARDRLVPVERVASAVTGGLIGLIVGPVGAVVEAVGGDGCRWRCREEDRYRAAQRVPCGRGGEA